MMRAFLIDPASEQRWDAVVKMVELMYKPHIYSTLCNEFKHLYYAHKMFREVEDGKRIVIFTAIDNIITGCVHGVIKDGIYECHIMFQRKVDAVRGCLLCEEELIKYCRANAIELEAIQGNICSANKAALRCALRWGAIDKGESDTPGFWCGEEKLPCHLVEKEVKL